jgi:hypothetical protein
MNYYVGLKGSSLTLHGLPMVKNVDGGQVGIFLEQNFAEYKSSFILNFVNNLKL